MWSRWPVAPHLEDACPPGGYQLVGLLMWRTLALDNDLKGNYRRHLPAWKTRQWFAVKGFVECGGEDESNGYRCIVCKGFEKNEVNLIFAGTVRFMFQ